MSNEQRATSHERGRLALLELVAAALVGGMSVWAVDAPVTPPPKAKPVVNATLPDKAIPQGIGFNVHILGPDTEWDALKESGVKFIRADFSWDGDERVKGVYDFAKHDKLLDAMDARGIRILAVLAYRNEKLYPNPETTDEGREAYSKWAAANVKHFKGRNIMWEIWNEPNVGFWHGKSGKMNSAEYATEYLALVKKAVPAMREADPDCYILAGSVSCLWRDSFRWIDEVLKQDLLKTGINALSVHPYGYSRPELCIDLKQPGTNPNESYGLLRDKMAAVGTPKDFPVVNSEVGYNTGKNVNQEQQAMLFVRTCLVDQMCDIRMTIWYNWDPNDAGSHKVHTATGPLLPVYKACKNMTAEMTGYHFVERLKVGTSVDYVFAFENAAKERKVVAWTVPQARDDSQDKAKAHDLAIPTTGSTGPVAVRDLYGKDVPAKAENDAVTVNLTASPLYIDLTGKPRVAPAK
jgi:polysaccharide biosynthesis protein PslG